MNRLATLAQGQSPIYVSPEVPVFEAAKKMTEKKVGAILVGDEKTLLGLFSERDLMNRVISRGLDCSKTKVSDVMTRNVITVMTDETVEHCHQRMIEFKCRHLPILEAGKVIGMVSMRDVLEWMVEDAEDENKALKQYIQT